MVRWASHVFFVFGRYSMIHNHDTSQQNVRGIVTYRLSNVSKPSSTGDRLHSGSERGSDMEDH